MTMLLQLLGFAALAAAMYATPRRVRLQPGGRAWRAAPVCGAILLALSMLVASRSRPIGQAIVDWFGLATLSAGLILLALAVIRRRA